jgi:hypothetical protein
VADGSGLLPRQGRRPYLPLRPVNRTLNEDAGLFRQITEGLGYVGLRKNAPEAQPPWGQAFPARAPAAESEHVECG